MKYFFICIALFLTHSVCAQDKIESMEEVNEIFSDLGEYVKYRDQSVNYHANIYIGAVNFEVLINDFPVQKFYRPASGAISTSIPINTAILKSGKQTWKIKVYPSLTHKVDENGDIIASIPDSVIAKGGRIEMNIEGIYYDDNDHIVKEDHGIVNFEAPLTEDPETGRMILVDAGKPYVEYSGTFEAKVPYHSEGWRNGQDLTDLDKDELEEKVVKAYKEFSESWGNKKVSKLAKLKIKEVQETVQALFFSHKQINEYPKEFYLYFTESNLTMEPIENYRIKIYGDGKLVNLERVDILGLTPLFGDYESENGEIRSKLTELYLYLPEGKEELEIIRTSF